MTAQQQVAYDAAQKAAIEALKSGDEATHKAETDKALAIKKGAK